MTSTSEGTRTRDSSTPSPGALGAWLHPTPPTTAAQEPSATAGVIALPHAGSQSAADAAATGEHVGEAATSGAALAGPEQRVEQRLERKRVRLAYRRGVAELERDPAWLDRLSWWERRREAAAARRVRGAQRRQLLAGARSGQQLARVEQRADARLTAAEVRDRIWHRRALSRRHRILDPASRLAAIHRTNVVASLVLQAVALAGIVWTSVGVHDALVGPGGSPLAYLVEPIFSLPLLVFMAVTALAAQWGHVFPAPAQRRQVFAIEAGLFAVTVALNTFPVLPGVGRWQGATVLLAHLVPPGLILVALVGQLVVSGFLSKLLVDAYVEATETGASRLDLDTLNVVRMVARVQSAVTAGDLEPWADTGLPSVSAIARYFTCEKRKAQAVHDALAELATPATEHRRTRRIADGVR